MKSLSKYITESFNINEASQKEHKLLVDWFKLDDEAWPEEFSQLEAWYGENLGNKLSKWTGNKAFAGKTSDEIWGDSGLKSSALTWLKDESKKRKKAQKEIQKELIKTWPSLSKIDPDEDTPGLAIRGTKLNTSKRGYRLFTTDGDFESYDKLDDETVDDYKNFLSVRQGAYKEWQSKHKGKTDF